MAKQEQLYSAPRAQEHRRGHRSRHSITAPEYRHRRQTSEAPQSAVPSHMRTASMGHRRDLSTASSIVPIGSPDSATPDDHMFRPMYGVPQYMPQQQQYLYHPYYRVHHYHHPPHGAFINPYRPPEYDQYRMGSPGPLVPAASRQPQGLTGLTPLLNISPYLEQGGQGQGGPGAKRFVHPEANTRPPKRLKREEPQQPEQDIFKVPLHEYTENVAEKSWTSDDDSELLALLESAEKYKWRYISDRMFQVKKKRIPSLACSRKFRDMFGVPEASSALDSSLFYVALRSGWGAIKKERTSTEKNQEPRGS